MSKIEIGRKIPDFTAPATGGQTIQLSQLKGQNIVLYFYPKDNTPGCTVEGQDFAAQHMKFRRAKTAVFGVSRDSLKSHENFKAKFAFPFELISDADETLCGLFGVLKEKNMYGRKVMGVERSTFLIDADGVLRKEWRGVKVEGHVDEILAAAKAL